MKKLQILVIMALVMTFGCSNEDLINTEQDSIISDSDLIYTKNDKNDVSKGFGNDISFQFSSIINDEFEANCLPIGRRILKSGFFEGNIQGYGVIKPSLSYYNFSNYCLEVEVDSTMPNYGEQWKYELKIIGGVVATSNKDSFLVDIEGDLYPWYDNNLNIDTGTFIGIAKTYSGKGKFKNFIRTFNVGKYGPDGLDLGTGELHFWVH